MKRAILVILFAILFAIPSFSQKTVAVSNIALKNKREAIPVINAEGNELSLFITDRKNIYLKKYNESFKLIGEEVFERPKLQLKNIVEAVTTSENEYIFLLSDSFKKNFGVLKINSQQKTLEIITDSLMFSGDKYVITLKNNNEIYVITIKENQSNFGIHKINANGSLTSLQYDLTNEDFFNRKNEKVSLYKALLHRINSIDPGRLGLEYIETDIPNSLEKTSKKAKLFVDGKKIKLLLDQSSKFSQIVTLNLDSIDYEVNNIKKVDVSDYRSIKSNSFISKNNLYQLIASKERLKFAVIDISSKKVLKEIHLNQDDSIIFKNTPIVQEGGVYVNHREMEKTKKFLRKITASNVGVSVYHSKDSIQITLGGLKEYKGAVGAPGFGPGVGPMGFATPTFFAFSSYAGSKSTYIKCLFDKNLTHISGDIPSNGFDKIDALKKEILDENTETIFKFNNYLIYGYHYPKHYSYYLRKFED